MSRYIDPHATSPSGTDTPVGGMLSDDGSAMMHHTESSLIMGPCGVGGTDESNNRIIDLSNGLRVEFIRRAGLPAKGRMAAKEEDDHLEGSPSSAANLSPSASKKATETGVGLTGRRITPFADVVMDYKLMKAEDRVGGPKATSRQYADFEFGTDEPLADRMLAKDVYEGVDDFEMKFVPSYNECPSTAIYGLNLAFPYLREGDEALIFTPSYLAPVPIPNDPMLGADFRPARLYDEVKQEYIEPPQPPVMNTQYDEHSFIHVVIKKVYPEEALTTDRYITKTVIREGKGASSSSASSEGGVGRKLNMNQEEGDDANTKDDPANNNKGSVRASTTAPPRKVSLGSVVTFDIGEVNEYLNKPLHFKQVSNCTVASAVTCDEMDIVLMSMGEGEYCSFKIGSAKYHLKLLEIAAGTAAGEVVGDAATELARQLKDAGNAVLSVDASVGTRQFSSPARQPGKGGSVGMGSPSPSFGSGPSASSFSETPEMLAAARYFSPPSDLTANAILDALSTFVVRPARSSYLRCVKAPTAGLTHATSTSGIGPKAPPLEPYADRVQAEGTFRALQLYRHAERVLLDEGGSFYNDDEPEVKTPSTASPPLSSLSPTHSPKAPKVASGTATDAALAKAKANYNFDKRSELLGTIYGNTAQVYLNLHFYEEAERSASNAIERCAASDVYKHYYRRAKARRAKGAIAEAVGDLEKVRELFKHMNVPKSDTRIDELDKELRKCAAMLPA